MTRRQQQCWAFIKRHMRANKGAFPTIREIAVGLGLSIKSVNNVHRMLGELKAMGIVKRETNSRVVLVVDRCPMCGHRKAKKAA